MYWVVGFFLLAVLVNLASVVPAYLTLTLTRGLFKRVWVASREKWVPLRCLCLPRRGV